MDVAALERQRQAQAAASGPARVQIPLLPGVELDDRRPRRACPTCGERESPGTFRSRVFGVHHMDCHPCESKRRRRESTRRVAVQTEIPPPLNAGRWVELYHELCKSPKWPSARPSSFHAQSMLDELQGTLSMAQLERGVRRALALADFFPTAADLRDLGTS